MIKFCPKCGSEIEDPDQKFCKTCGANLQEREKKESPSPMRIEQEVEGAVKLQPEYANVGPRFLAFLLDAILIGIISNIIYAIINLPVFLANPIAFVQLQNLWASSLINWGIGFLYFWLLEAYNQGQTIGKLALKLRTVDKDTLEVAPPVNYAINNLAKPSPFLILDILIGLLISAGDLKNRIRVLQNLSNTVVIQE